MWPFKKRIKPQVNNNVDNIGSEYIRVSVAAIITSYDFVSSKRVVMKFKVGGTTSLVNVPIALCEKYPIGTKIYFFSELL